MAWRLALSVLVAVSGTAGLIYQLLWFRVLDLLFGVTGYAVAATLALFMLGLALGAYGFGRLADRSPQPWRLFVGLELGTALGALGAFVLAWWTPAADGLLGLVYRTLPPAAGLPIRLLLAAALVLPNTICMGGSLPVLTRALVRQSARLGRGYGGLYALNTLGAVGGTLLVGFVLLPHLGITGSLWVAAGLNGVVAVGVAGLARMGVPYGGRLPTAASTASLATPPGADADAIASRPADRLMAPMLFLSGFMLMTLEVLWLRILTNYGEGTTYAFTAILASVLLGLALGGLISAALADRLAGAAGRLTYALVLAALGLMSARVLQALGAMAEGDLGWAALPLRLWPGLSRLIGLETAVGALLAGAVAVPFGFLFPLGVRCYAGTIDGLGGKVGRLHLVNAAGLALGSLAAGFILLPRFGPRGTHAGLLVLGYAGVFTLLMANLAAAARARHRAAAWRTGTGLAVALVCIGLAMRAHQRTRAHFYLQGADETVYFYAEGASGTVTVLGRQVGDAVYKTLMVDSHAVSGDYPQLTPDPKLLAHIPLLLAPHPEAAATVGFGTGGTSRSMRLHGVGVTAIEIEPAVIRASAEFFGLHGGVLDDPGFELVLDDARHFLARTDRRFDVIVSDVTSPKYRRNAFLYTREYFESMRRCLRPAGVAGTWIPFSGISDADIRMIVGTFSDVFPHTTLWALVRGRAIFLLAIGAREPFVIDLDTWDRRYARVRPDLARIGLTDPAQVGALLLMGAQDVARYTQGAARTTDNRPRLEFSDLAAYMHGTHEDAYRAMMAEQHEDLTAYFRGPPERIAALRTAFADARHAAESWREQFRPPEPIPP